jgi:arsenate reductase (glutaredoxin)
MLTVYGIPNCDSVKKAITWLSKNNFEYKFYNFKTEGIPTSLSKKWIAQKGIDIIINKKSTTYKALTEAEQKKLLTPTNALNIIESHTSAVKRPIITRNETIVAVGFNESEYEAIFLSP